MGKSRLFFQSREEGSAWEICILDRSLCGLGRSSQDCRQGTN